MATRKMEIDDRLPSDLERMIRGVADQCAKGQYFNALSRLNELERDLLHRLQEAIRGTQDMGD